MHPAEAECTGSLPTLLLLGLLAVWLFDVSHYIDCRDFSQLPGLSIAPTTRPAKLYGLRWRRYSKTYYSNGVVVSAHSSSAAPLSKRGVARQNHIGCGNPLCVVLRGSVVACYAVGSAGSGTVVAPWAVTPTEACPSALPVNWDGRGHATARKCVAATATGGELSWSRSAPL